MNSIGFIRLDLYLLDSTEDIKIKQYININHIVNMIEYYDHTEISLINSTVRVREKPEEIMQLIDNERARDILRSKPKIMEG